MTHPASQTDTGWKSPALSVMPGAGNVAVRGRDGWLNKVMGDVECLLLCGCGWRDE